MTGLLSAWRMWQERRQVLRDIRREAADEHERNRFKVRDELVEAIATVKINDRAKAARIWAAANEKYPREARESPLAYKLLIDLGRYNEAEALLREGQKKHPRDIFFFRGLLDVALSRGDHDSAILRCAELRNRFPGVPQGYVMGASALQAKGKLDAAQALADEAMKRFPSEIGGFLRNADIAMLREDWPEALGRWQLVQDKFESWAFGHVGRASVYIKLGEYDKADEVLVAARFRLPTDIGIVAEYARCAQARGDLAEAKVRWNRLLERFPMEWIGYVYAGESYEQMGDNEAVEAVFKAAIERFPQEEGPHLRLANFLRGRKEYEKEAAVWAGMRVAFPSYSEAYVRGAEALRQIGKHDECAALREEHQRMFSA